VIRLALSPTAFWALSLIEWRWLLTAALGEGSDAMDLPALNALLQHYPDKTL